MPVNAAKDLEVHKKAHALVLSVYRLTGRFPKEEMFGLSSQLRRAAFSVPANISEGFAKRTRAEKLRFYNIAQGSLEEVRYYLMLGNDLGYGDTTALSRDADEVGRMLGAYIGKIEADRRRFFPLLFLLLASCFLLLVSRTAAAAPSLQDVARSTQEHVDGDVDLSATTFLPILGGAILLIVIVAAANRRREKKAVPSALNHQGKLLKEVLRAVPLRGREVKQLRALAERAGGDRPLASPLTLMLCPSVLANAIQTQKPRGDRKALVAVAKKAGLKVTTK